MSARLHQNNQEILKSFIPLNTLPSANFASICTECLVEECAKGTILFEQGDDVKEFIYLISGMVSLYAGEMEMETIVTGSEVARFAIAHHIPRKVKAITKSKVRIVRIPTHMLDIDRPTDDGQTYLVDETEDQGGDWMTTMLQSPVFQRLPASNLQKVMMQMEEIAFGPGEVVVKQGDEADFYYIIKSGDCELIRQSSEGARPVKLAELHSCDAFGEDALLSGNARNVTVRMKGKGQMLRLSKANFISLVKEPVLQYVTYEEGLDKVGSGANWLDVRSADEYAADSIDGSVNIPFFSLRMKVSELRHDQQQVLVCEKGRVSEAAAFLLLKFGFNALILKGGMASLDKSEAMPVVSTKPLPEQEPKAVVIKKNDSLAPEFNAGNALDVEQLKESQEATRSRETLSELALDLSLKDQELESLKLALNSVKEQEEEIAEELRLQLSVANLEVTELESQKIALENIASEARREADELSQSKALLEQRIEDSSQNSNSSISEKDSHISELNAELSEVRLELTQYEQSKEELNQSLLGAATELEKAKESEKAAIEQSKVDLDASRDGFENELGVLQKQLEEKANDLGSQIEKVEALEAELDSLGDAAQGHDSVLREKDADINAFIKKLDQAEASITSLGEKQQELESQLIEKNGLLSESSEKLSNLNAERDDLEEKLEQSDDGLSGLSTEQAELKSQLNDALQSIGELKTNESNLLADAAELKQQSERTEKELETTVKELAGSSTRAQNLGQESEALRDRLASVEASLTAVASGKETLEGELTQRLSMAERDLAAALENKADIAQQLESANEEKGVAQKKLLELNGQLESDLDGQNLLNTQLAKVQEELSDLRQRSEDEKAQLLDSIQQANLHAEESNSSRDALSKELEASIKQNLEMLAKLEGELVSAKDSKTKVEARLDKLVSKNESVRQELLVFQRQVEGSLDGQQQLKDQLAQAHEKVGLAVQEKNVERVKFEESKALAESAEHRYVEVSKALDALSSEQAAADGLLKGQLVELERKLKYSEEASRTLTGNVKSAEYGLSAAIDGKNKALTELEEFKRDSLSDNDAAKLLGEEIDELKCALQQVKEEKERLVVDAEKQNDEKLTKLAEELLEAKEAGKHSLQRAEELVVSSAVDEKEKAALEKKLEAANTKNSEILNRVADAERKTSKAVDKSGDEARIKELEKQLDDASSMLLNLEIKLETSAVDEIVEPKEEERDELKALQSELNLVREQTEKDIQAMQEKVGSSEKMNLALKKKILSMQAITNQEGLLEALPKEKKKSWW